MPRRGRRRKLRACSSRGTRLPKAGSPPRASPLRSFSSSPVMAGRSSCPSSPAILPLRWTLTMSAASNAPGRRRPCARRRFSAAPLSRLVLRAKAIATWSVSNSRKPSAPTSIRPTSRRKDFVSCARSSCTSAQSLWRSSSISARAARRLRSTPRRATGPPRHYSSDMATSAAWPGRKEASPISSPEKGTRRLCYGSPTRSGRRRRRPPINRRLTLRCRLHLGPSASLSRVSLRHAGRRRVVSGKVAVEVASYGGRPLLVAVAKIVLDGRGDGLARVVVGPRYLLHLLLRCPSLGFSRQEVRSELVGIEHEAAMARPRRGPSDLNGSCQGVLWRHVARFLLGRGAVLASDAIDGAAGRKRREQERRGNGKSGIGRALCTSSFHGGRS